MTALGGPTGPAWISSGTRSVTFGPTPGWWRPVSRTRRLVRWCAPLTPRVVAPTGPWVYVIGQGSCKDRGISRLARLRSGCRHPDGADPRERPDGPVGTPRPDQRRRAVGAGRVVGA